jgi:allophanate hydrolase subunit 1
MSDDRSSVTLRALEGEPLKHDRIREMVMATAHALGERQGVEVLEVSADSSSITVTLAAPRLVAYGFAAELRRLTTRWYAHKFGVETLWGAAPGDGETEAP